ncbi:nucleoporin Seh1 [Schizosaccharomyces japonicus yFS275]|uniref:Nucleoporin Seh1 n=1 Tax=Schizosaccharomyces japonicus (strain yFS275 / FY16936) TaxID=402676 RepID=B6K2F5_SCHJY|nr:nucleoporin Seh1 [Schizosaccharomyces japonicus yFS275]EEB07336.1 nucleoporin Seh1 [Schizosaccharomyces japonicus yFS275]
MEQTVDTRVINTNHQDVILDVAYDFYGQRMATCSADQHVKIYDLDESTKEWVPVATFKAGDASVLRLMWAHPEYGQAVATCSLDRTVRIFTEQEAEADTKKWVESARLTDARSSVMDICFAPVRLGCKLATVAADATVRIYEAIEPGNMASWTLLEEFGLMKNPPSRNVECSFCVRWCPSRWHNQMLAVGCMDQVLLYSYNRKNKWTKVGSLDGHTDLVRDIAWAPSLGKNYHLVATGCKDGRLRLFKLNRNFESAVQPYLMTDSVSENEDGEMTNSNVEAEDVEVELVGNYDHFKSQVWRCEFNVTGTILSTSGDDGCVRLWKTSYANQFNCISVISLQRENKSFSSN